MKYTNRKRIACITLAMLMISGCGSRIELERPYDMYTMETAGAIGPAGSNDLSASDYLFANGLCVADDIEVGTDVTTSQVAEGAGVFNLATKEITYQKNIYTKLYPASTTKILTAYLTLKYCEDLDTVTTVSENAVNQAADSSVCGLNAGDVISIRALLYGLMLRSGNDAAIVLAEQISGSCDAFTELMNREALLLGASQTHYVNPNGLPDENHYTSVYDLYLMFQAAISDERFVDIISTISYEAVYQDAAGASVTKEWENTNQYFTGYTQAPEGITVIGGKTGTTNAAGYCLVLYSKNRNGEPIISIVLKADGKSNLYLLMNEMLRDFCGNQ